MSVLNGRCYNWCNMKVFTRIVSIFRRSWFKEAIKFGMVGLVGAVVDLGLLNLLHLVVGLSIFQSVFWAFVAAVLVNYALNNYWTYRHLNLKFRTSDLLKFATISTVGLGITEVMIRVLSVEKGLNYNLVKIIAIAVVFFWNFFGNRVWTFRNRS